MSNNIQALIMAAETREANVESVLALLRFLPQPEIIEVLVAALLRAQGPLQPHVSPTMVAPVPPLVVTPPRVMVAPPRATKRPRFPDEPVAAPAPSLPEAPPNPPKARPTARKGSGQQATRLLSQEDAARLVELVGSHPGSSSPWLAKQLGVNQAGQRWRNTLQAAIETGVLRKEGKDNKTRYFKGPNAAT